MFDPSRHTGRKARLRGFDYSISGAYFVTVVTHQRRHLFGHVTAHGVEHTPLGARVAHELAALSLHHENAQVDSFVVMPDHVHAIILLTVDGAKSLSQIINGFKAATTRLARSSTQSPDFRLWGKGFHDHIIRTDDAVSRIRDYIEMNPLRWWLRETKQI